MNHIVKVFFITILVSTGVLLSVGISHSDDTLDTYQMDEITVIADQQVRYIDDPSASVMVLTREDIESYHATSIFDILSQAASVDIRQRGTAGSQADISIRGSSIEGVLILVDGVRIHDPQTGHYTLDLPVGLSSVERIEILSGGGAGVYGGTASGGVINIVTSSGGESLNAALTGGSFGSGNGQLSLSHEWDNSSARLTFRSGTSDGYRSDTDIRYQGLSASGDASSESIRLKWNAGILSKSFGAGDFYGPYPSSEDVATFQGSVNLSYVVDDHQLLRFRGGSRGHDDKFTLIRDNPAYYRNLHYNRSTTGAMEYIATIGHATTFTSGIELERYGITSGSLGEHSDNTSAIYTQFSTRYNNITINSALRLDSGYRGDTVFSPVLGFVYHARQGINLSIRADRSYRPPTYTDMYYKSPANSGNPSIRPEYQNSIEIGFDLSGTKKSYSIRYFASEATDVIDWIRNSGETIWRAENHGRIDTRGIETAVNYSYCNNTTIRLQALLLDQIVSRQAGIESKYALTPLDRVLTCSVTGPLFNSLSYALITRYEHQRGISERIPVSLRFGWDIYAASCGITIDNLFDESYEEFPGLPAPGRWITFQVEYSR